MKVVAITLCGLILACCSQRLSPPVFDEETTKKWQVGYTFRNQSREEVHAHTGGTVVFVSDDPNNATNLGKYVVLEHTKMLTAGGANARFKYYTLYALLGETSVKVGQLVNVNAKVGMSGPTGRVAALENGATLLFAVYAETQNESIDQLWGNPIKAYGKFWYDLEQVMGGSPGSPDKLTSNFDIGSYVRTNLDTLLSAVRPDGGDQNLGFKKYVLSQEIPELPSPLSAAEQGGIATYVQANSLPVMMNRLYGSRFYVQKKDFKVAFFLQGALLETFSTEVAVGKTVDLYVICGFYDGKQRVLCLLVNAFNAQK